MAVLVAVTVAVRDTSRPSAAEAGSRSKVWVSGSSAVPDDSGTSWSLCNLQGQPACTGGGGLPGKNQYAVSTFGSQVANFSVLTGSAACDNEFVPGGGCSATPAQFQSQTRHEGLQLTGPKTWDDGSTSWSVSITWIAESPGRAASCPGRDVVGGV
jgi:hypothetical protein